MRNNTTGGRSVARGNGRNASATGRRSEGRPSQGRPAGRSRYSAGEGSVRNSADESPAKRGYGRTSAAGRQSGSGRASGAGRPTGAGRAAGAGRTAASGRNSGTGRSYAGRFAKATEAPKPQPVKLKSAEDGVRLNKFIANSGICSRREADDFIAAGLVSVNGKVVTELGTKVFPADEVRFNGERIKGEEKVYILMNKPKDFVTTVSDPHAEKTVVSIVSSKCKERVYPVGRLDKATTGVLLLTNDGDLAEKLTHPSYEKKKIYHVHLDKNFKQTDLSELLRGVTLEDGFIQADAISYVDEDKAQVGVEIHSGRNRIIRRMFEHLGYKVKKLDRVYFAGLTKKNLRRGQWRFLTEQEVAMLKMGSYE
ncbi:MAG: rRNA pseudouridine synthase [Bacteroidales bacterium]|nr:rRNA pseudouridine synthase [Bacteroidales bacterium]